jgi:flagella basal body P-ring formation protein FlgA
MNRSPVLARDTLMTLAVAMMATFMLLLLNSSVMYAQPSPSGNARGTARVTWPKALRAFQRGDTVRAGDYVLADTVIAWHWTNVQPDSTRAITGWLTRRPIALGEFMRSPAVAPAPVVILGSTVKVLWQDGTLRLTLVGTATNNAPLGGPVGVRIDKNRRLDGVAVAPNTVRIR